MKVVTRLKLYAGTMVVAAVAAFAVYQAGPPGPDDAYLVSVKWIPGVLPKLNPVLITISVDGFPMPIRTRNLSPYSETMAVATGAAVVVVATAEHPGITFFDCILLRNGKVVPGTGYDSRKGPGKVSCAA